MNDIIKQHTAALLIACGVALSGYFIKLGIDHYTDKDRVVTVKGLATRDVEADYAVWPLRFSLSGDDTQELYRQMSATRGQVRNFLKSKGFAEEDIKFGQVSVNDNWENYYGSRPERHYTLTCNLAVTTNNTALVKSTNGLECELLQQGIILSSNEWSLDYQFNGLAELKPSMIEEATKNARAVAQKFADDAECQLGSIKTANQGQFSIESDDNQPWIKHVRVVTTVEYYLK